MGAIDHFLSVFVGYAWGLPLVFLLVGGGLILTLLCRFLPFKGARHAINILRGKYDKPDDPGEISHFRALSTALSSTIGMGNIGGVAVAITQGGPGALFWMWVAAAVGMATKFFTCTLAVLYRGKDNLGRLQGGPMYYIEIGLGRRWKFLAVFFAFCGLCGFLPMFQANQLVEALQSTYQMEAVQLGSFALPMPWLIGFFVVGTVALVVLGGLQRISAVAARLVPAMCLLYMVISLIVVLRNYVLVPQIFAQIFHDAFTGSAAVGGAAGIGFKAVLQTGVKRAAFSNEAGIGSAPLAHGAARTSEPVREGLVAMLGPFIDTIVICTLTAIVVLAADQWRGSEIQGIALTAGAFELALGGFGRFLLILVAALFALSTMFGYSYYGRKCFGYLFGSQRTKIYDYLYLLMIFVGAIWSAEAVVNLIDSAFALMAIPTMISTLLLAPKVVRATREYFSRQHM